MAFSESDFTCSFELLPHLSIMALSTPLPFSEEVEVCVCVCVYEIGQREKGEEE